MMMGGDRSAMMSSMNGVTIRRHQDFSQGRVPEEYQNVRPSMTIDSDVLAQGETVYQENCAACHGATGLGDGEAGAELNPRPVNLSAMPYGKMPVDGLLFYAISEGGEKYGSDMRTFKDTLSEQERWAAVAYVKQGLAN